jgi:CRISPR-associated protein Csa2
MLYYVELASTIYTFSLDIDTRYIGKIAFNVEKAGTPVVGDAERVARATAFIDAVKKLLVESSFGAKRTRFLPTIDWESMVIAVSDRPWTVPTSFTKSYIERAQKKKEKISHNTELYTFEGGSFETYVSEALDRIKQRIAS